MTEFLVKSHINIFLYGFTECKLSFTAKDLSIGLALMKVSKLGTLKKKVEIKHKCVLKTFLLKVIIKCEIILLC